MRVLVTGASGLVGGAVVQALAARADVELVVPLRRHYSGLPARAMRFAISGVDTKQDWLPALRGVQVVVHCAGRVHVLNERASDPLSQFRLINVDGTMQLARQAADAGVKRFVFLSSIKVNGEETTPGFPFRADQSPHPKDPYGVSKMEAEARLRSLAAETDLEVVIIRPPLVYGPGVQANFLAMMRWISLGIPLPLGRVTENRRSLVALDNLVDLISKCLDHSAAVDQTFLVSDGESMSTATLLRRMAYALGRPSRLMPVPLPILTAGTVLLGKREVARRLLGSLEVDIKSTQERLGWTPPISVDEGLQRAAQPWVTGSHASL
jgi:nucleoside-diphosphate-sugar epimerase